MYRKFIICATGLIIFIGCKKLNDNTPAPAQSNLSLLTSKSWKFSGETYDGQNNWPSDDTCKTDAKFTFNADYTYTYIGCDSSDAYEDSTSGHWAFLNPGQTVIVFHPKAVDADTFQISTITSSVLVLLQYRSGAAYSETFLKQ